jgi:DMSO/TMAO reductase YedYZ molybdopterin-dependent catalytic subunit
MVKEDATIISPDTKRDNRVPPGQKLIESWPTLHYGNVPKVDTSKWQFRILPLQVYKRY